MEIQSFTAWQVVLLLLTAVGAILLAWIIVRLIYRKSLQEFRKHKFDEEN